VSPNDSTLQNVIIVEGRGSVEVSPDVAVLQVSLEADADSAGDALSIVSDRAIAVMSAARGIGLDDDDVKTTGLNVFPQMDQSGLRIHHYRAWYGLGVRLRDITNGPRLIESVSAAAGDALRLGGFHLTVSDPGAARAEAGVRAVTDAQERAGRLADAAGLRLGRILSIVDSQAAGWSRPRMAMARAAAPMPPQPPLESGTEEIAAQATVTFEILS
jgi:uncharacterized protein